MNFDRKGEAFMKWCKVMDVSPNQMDQVICRKLFECINKLMEDSLKCCNEGAVVAPVVENADYVPKFDEMTENELRKWLEDNDAKPHHMAKRETLLKAAKSL